MPTNDKMTIDERFKYLRIAHQRYAVAGRQPRAAAQARSGATY